MKTTALAIVLVVGAVTLGAQQQQLQITDGHIGTTCWTLVALVLENRDASEDIAAFTRTARAIRERRQDSCWEDFFSAITPTRPPLPPSPPLNYFETNWIHIPVPPDWTEEQLRETLDTVIESGAAPLLRAPLPGPARRR